MDPAYYLHGSEGSRMLRVFTYIWALPTTIIGLLFIPLALISGEVRFVDGVLELNGRWIAFILSRLIPIYGGAAAMTLGHVVIGRDRHCLEFTRRHERVHVKQCERWGPLFIPAYLTASAIVKIRGKNAYMDNPFEREAYGPSPRRSNHHPMR
jgi:hypothetical protein